ncbi:MAG: dUTP diphosphatase [Nanoarchaeota archaeon]|nr:dUTP diphosphatase [Nanoarchaeota archaeon]MBU1976586.1 dUTP diphosphatase [Nanoarchaeota archaeon]
MTLKIKKLHPEAKMPSYANPGDAGMDFYSNEDLILQPNERKLIPTGISMAIPKGYVGLIWDKSGLASKYGIKTMAGVIDSGYRGEIKILVHNLSADPFEIKRSTKIAQMLIQPIEQKELIEVDELEDTERGEKGFGSTGLS